MIRMWRNRSKPIANPLGWLNLLLLMICVWPVTAQTVTPTTPVWQAGEFTVPPNRESGQNHKQTDDPDFPGTISGANWVAMDADNPLFFEMRSTQVASLLRRDQADPTSINIHITQGRGLFPATVYERWTEPRRILANPHSRDVWVMLTSTKPVEVKLAIADEDALSGRDYWREIPVKRSDADDVRHVDTEGGVPRELLSLPRGQVFTYRAERDERLRLDYFVDFSDLRDLSNVPVQMHWQIDKQAQSSEVRYANFNFKALNQDQCTLALSFRESIVMELKQGQKVTFSASQPGFLAMAANRSGHYFFTANRAKFDLNWQTKPTPAALSEKWYGMLRAYNLPVPLKLTNENNKLTARRGIFPQRNKHSAIWAYSLRARPFDFNGADDTHSSLNGLHFSNEHSASNLTKMVLGHYHRLDTTQPTLTYELPPNRMLAELELEVATPRPGLGAVSLQILIDDHPQQDWILIPWLQALTARPSSLSTYLEAEFGQGLGVTRGVSFSDQFARLRQRAPMVQTNMAYIPVPDYAKRISISLANRIDQPQTTQWVSVRDFVYRSNLGDVTVLNDSKVKTRTRLNDAFNLFRQIEHDFGLGEDDLATPEIEELQKNLVSQLETLSLQQQQDLAQWARFFHVVRNARSSLVTEYIDEPNGAELRRFEKLDGGLWRDMSRWLQGPQPSSTVHVLIGLTLHHSQQAVRAQALNTLIAHPAALSKRRLRDVIVAYLYRDMDRINAVVSTLTALWSDLGNHHLLSLFHNVDDIPEHLDLLRSLVQQNSPSALRHHLEQARPESEQGQILYDVAKLISHEDIFDFAAQNTLMQAYMEIYGFWRSNQQAVQQYTQHINLLHKTRDELVQKAFLIGPDASLTLNTNELWRYRLKVAPAFGMQHNRTETVSRSAHTITIGDDQRTITSVNTGNWIAAIPGQPSSNGSVRSFRAHHVGKFSTLSLGVKENEGAPVKIFANRSTVIYLERMEDPAGILRRLSVPLETVKIKAFEPIVSGLASPMRVLLSKPPDATGHCSAPQQRSLSQAKNIRPVDISHVRQSFSTARAEYSWAISGMVTDEVLASNRYSVATAARHLHLADNQEMRRRYPDLRARALQHAAWRELLDVPIHAGTVNLKNKPALALSQAESQRRALSTRLGQDHAFSVSGRNAQGVRLYSPIRQPVSLIVRARKRLFEPAIPVEFWLKLGGETAQKHQIQLGAKRRLLVPLEQGNNVVKLWMADENAKQTLSFDFDLPRNMQPIDNYAQRYFLARSDSEIELAVNGPQRLRVLTTNGQGHSRVQELHLPSGLNKRRFRPDGDFRFFRFFILRENYSATQEVVETERVELSPATCYKGAECLTRSSKLDDDELSVIRKLNLHQIPDTSYSLSQLELSQLGAASRNDHSLPFEQGVITDKPTLGLEVSWVDRDTNDDDPDSTEQLNSSFVQFDGKYRQRRQHRAQISTVDASYRHYDLAQVYRLNARNDWLRGGSKGGGKRALDYALGGEVWHQTSSNANPSINSGQIYARARYTGSLNPRLNLSTRGRIWYRASDAEAVDFSLIDSDVWSEFKQNHRFGVGLRQRATYRTTLDSETYLQTSVLSNEDLLSIDRQGVSLGWRAYLKRASADINFRHREFLNDGDRSERFARTDLNVSADWLLPITAASNLRLSARARYNTNDKQMSWWLNVGWFQHAGQQLFDLRADEIRFRGPRNWWLRSEPLRNDRIKVERE